MLDMMEEYIGTKVIKAEPMTRGEYAELSGRNSILTEKGESESDAGYHVRYADGYESWSPAKAFEDAYQPFEKMSFGHAIEMLKKGYAVAREGWNGRGQYIQLASRISFMDPTGELYNADHETMGNQAIVFFGTSGIQVGWLASQADILSNDWTVVYLEK